MMRSQVRERIAVQLPEHASPKQCYELGAFARYCILRVERELGEWESWVVHVVPSPDGYASHIALHDRGVLLEEQGSGQDGALATWDAMCRIEQRMRERRRRDPAIGVGAPCAVRITMVPAIPATPATPATPARLPRHRPARHRPARHRPARAARATSRARRPGIRRAPAR